MGAEVIRVNHNKEKVLEFLSAQNEPQGIQTIQKGAGIAHWNSTLSNCLELYILGKIRGMKTSKSWVFWVEKKQKAATKGGEVLVTA